jgi:acetyl-CoA carboxylase alpha subunit
MKYYSELTKKMYESEKELNEAEEKVREAEAEKEKKAVQASNEKKQLAKAIEDAEKELDEAYKELDAAREKARLLQKETLKQIEDILHPAEEKVKTVQARKFDAVHAFNAKYGPFTTTLTGAKAAEEMTRIWRAFDKLFDFDFFL